VLIIVSGARKSILLDVLASRKSISVITGKFLVDRNPEGMAFERGMSYAE
jgi:hypothetical protein